MQSLVIVNNPKDFNLDIEGIEVVSARAYLTDSRYFELKNVRIYNLCRTYKYQSIGYYVSLLAEARGHRIFPNITTIQDLKSLSIIRVISDELDQLIQKSLKKIRSKEFVLSIYFGDNMAKQYSNLSNKLYNLFQAPLLRATFTFNKKWLLQNINPIPINEIPESHRPYVLQFAKTYFAKKRIRAHRKHNTLFDLAILINPKDPEPPSNAKALQKFIEAGETLGFSCEFITKEDFNRIPEFDALFLRETTAVNHHTYRFSRRAVAEGLVVLDDPVSIVKCTNKVYLNELLIKSKIPTPRTLVVHKHNTDLVLNELGLPCVLKQPDSSFSLGVSKVEDLLTLQQEIERLLTTSELIVAQEFMPTEYDWRIGILDNRPLFACKYFMAKNHWQIYDWRASKSTQSGAAETLPLYEVPNKVITTALKAAKLIGDGLYGVDLKQVDDKVYVIEINDNPNIDYGIEDFVEQTNLYITIIQYFLNRVRNKRTF